MGSKFHQITQYIIDIAIFRVCKMVAICYLGFLKFECFCLVVSVRHQRTKFEQNRSNYKLRSYCSEVHQIFTWCSQTIPAVNMPIELWYSSSFWNARPMNEVNRPILPILTLKLVAIAMSLKQSEKECQITNLRSNWNACLMVTIGPVDPEIICFKWTLQKERNLCKQSI